MVRRTLEQILNKPKRPLTPYLKMRVELLKMLPVEYRKSSFVNSEWRSITPEKKAQLYLEYENEKKQFDKKMKAWRLGSFDITSTIKSDSLLNSVREESQNSESDQSCISGASKVYSLLRNVSEDMGTSRSLFKIQENQSFYLEDSEDGAIENHLSEIKRLVKRKEKRWKHQRKNLLNIIRAERERTQKIQSEYSRASNSLRATIENHSKTLQNI